MGGNHFIIGLGGTGGKIMRAFRKRIYQEFRDENPDNVYIGYLYIDSSAEMMDLNDPTWKILGTSIQLGKASQLLIKGSNLATVLESIANYPGIKNWIGDSRQWKDILNSIMGETLGGQKRRLGRFLFAANVKAFNDRLPSLVNSLQQKSGISDVTFHICCGLAGGTGSGSLIDVICQTRKLYNDPKKHQIIVYTLLPDEHPPHGWDTGNYHANGYANLMELNALSVGVYQPYDVAGTGRLKPQDPFNGCYVFSNENENGMKMDVSKEMPNIVSDFLYQKIVESDGWPTLKRMENAENGDGSPETEPGSKNPQRSKRFLAFGIKRLVNPEDDIFEYLTYNFTRQSALQLLYNNWLDSVGFYNESKIQDFNEYVRQKDVLERWRMADENICLSTGILDEDIGNKLWKPIRQDWQDIIGSFKSLIRESSDKSKWLDELGKLCAKRYGEDYRGLGVQQFYNLKTRAKREIAKYLRKIIESELFDNWRSGIRSTFEIGRLLESLLVYKGERLLDTDSKITKHRQNELLALDKVKANYAQWASTGLIGGLVGKKDRLLDSQAVYLQDMYTSKTYVEAWTFAKGFLEEFINELTDLKNEVDKCINTIKNASERFENQIAQRINDEGAKDLKQHMIRFYNPEKVRAINMRFIKDENAQKTQANQVRNALVEGLGENPGFKRFNERIGIEQFIDILEKECEQSAKRTHDNLIEDKRDKIIGVNIIEKLKEQYGADPHMLYGFVSNMVKYAGNYVIFTEIERQKKGPGIPSSPNCISQFTVMMPKTPEHKEFLGQLQEAFKKSSTVVPEIIETDLKQNEITMISITNMFPLRFLNILQFLRQKYDQRLEKIGKERACLELHTEGDVSMYPSLFVPSVRELVEEGLPYFLIAKAMGIIYEQQNKTSGVKELRLITKDENGFELSAFLGHSLSDIAEMLEHEQVSIIKTEVEKNLQSEYRLFEKREELKKPIQSDVNAIKAEHGFDDVYTKFVESAKKAFGILKG